MSSGKECGDWIGEGLISCFSPSSSKTLPALFFLPIGLHLVDFCSRFFEETVDLLGCLSSSKPKMTSVLLHPYL